MLGQSAPGGPAAPPPSATARYRASVRVRTATGCAAAPAANPPVAPSNPVRCGWYALQRQYCRPCRDGRRLPGASANRWHARRPASGPTRPCRPDRPAPRPLASTNNTGSCRASCAVAGVYGIHQNGTIETLVSKIMSILTQPRAPPRAQLEIFPKPRPAQPTPPLRCRDSKHCMVNAAPPATKPALVLCPTQWWDNLGFFPD